MIGPLEVGAEITSVNRLTPRLIPSRGRLKGLLGVKGLIRSSPYQSTVLESLLAAARVARNREQRPRKLSFIHPCSEGA